MIFRTLALGLLLLVVGCQTKPQVEIQHVNVAVPVPCSEPVPEKPVRPTEGLKPPVDLDLFVAAAVAEIDRLDAYSQELLTALENCRRPLKQEISLGSSKLKTY